MDALIPDVREADPSQAVAVHAADDKKSSKSSISSQVYEKMVKWLHPRLLHILESTRCLGHVDGKTQLSKTSPRIIFHQASAVAALAWYSQKLDHSPQRSAMQSQVRMWLNHWQRTLLPSGVPLSRRHRRSPYLGAIAGQIVQLLDQTCDFETPSLSGDLVRHLDWLADRPTRICWLEAASICALADGFFVLRETRFRDAAHKRLQVFLTSQKSEGWFPERGGADMGRHALTLDALARVHQQLGWHWLSQPLVRGIKFAQTMTHPDGTTGGVYSACHTGFASPYAMECMSTVSADAGQLATAYRLRLSQLSGEHLMSWHDDMCAILASRFALAGALDRQLSPPSSIDISENATHIHLPQAGLVIHRNRHYHAVVAYTFGGAIHLIWTKHPSVLSDPGIVVSFAHRSRSAMRWQPRVHVDLSQDSVDVSGILGKDPSDHSRRGSWWRRLGRQRRGKYNPKLILPPKTFRRSHAIDYDRLAHDHYQRRVEFLEDGIRIVDQLHCRLRCTSAMLQTTVQADARRWLDRAGAASCDDAPIVIEGGRHLQITRIYRNGVLVDAQ